VVHITQTFTEKWVVKVSVKTYFC